MKFISIKIEGTRLNWAIVTNDYKILDNGFVACNIINIKSDDLVTNITSLVETLEKKHKEIDVVTISLPGAVDQKTSKLIKRARWMSNIKENCLLKELFSKDENHTYHFVNDANAALLGSSVIGEAKKYENVVYFIAGTGIGTSLKLKGELYNGANNMSGEIGKVISSGTTIESNLSFNTLIAQASLVTGEEILDVEKLISISLISLEVKKLINDWYQTFLKTISNIIWFYDPELIEIQSKLYEHKLFSTEKLKMDLKELIGEEASKNINLTKVSEDLDAINYSFVGAVKSYLDNEK